MARPPVTRGLDPRALHARYAAGERINDLALEVGISRDTLRTLFRKSGLSTQEQAFNGKLVGVDLAPLHERYMAGESIHRIAASVGVWPGALRKRFKAAGLKLYPSGMHPNCRNSGGGRRPGAPGTRNIGEWKVEAQHECIAAGGVCLLCDEPIEASRYA